jgi:hypothetical protein
VETGMAEDRGCFLSAAENDVFCVMTSSPKLSWRNANCVLRLPK